MPSSLEGEWEYVWWNKHASEHASQIWKRKKEGWNISWIVTTVLWLLCFFFHHFKWWPARLLGMCFYVKNHNVPHIVCDSFLDCRTVKKKKQQKRKNEKKLSRACVWLSRADYSLFFFINTISRFVITSWKEINDYYAK